MKTLQVVEAIKQGKFDDQFLEIYADSKLVAYERTRYIQAIQRYNLVFDAGTGYDIEIFSAPGRSEIGGNHTDHQQGEVRQLLLTLNSRGVSRVHGGRFAGMIQAFVPDDLVETYQTAMENIFGPDSCQVLKIRKYGGIKVL